SWLGELENISVGHGVSLLQWRSGGVEHPHDTPPYPFMPSPTFAHSSARAWRRVSKPSEGAPVCFSPGRDLTRLNIAKDYPHTRSAGATSSACRSCRLK